MGARSTYHGEHRKFAKRLSNRAARRNKLTEENQNVHRIYKGLMWAYGPDYLVWSHNTKPRYKTRSRQSIRYPADNFEIALRYRGPAYDAA